MIKDQKKRLFGFIHQLLTNKKCHLYRINGVEYLVAVEWIQAVSSVGAKWKARSGLFTSQLIKASLQNQKVTREFLESEFGIDLRELLLQDQSLASGEEMDQTEKPIIN